MICKHCGASLKPNAVRCEYCDSDNPNYKDYTEDSNPNMITIKVEVPVRNYYPDRFSLIDACLNDVAIREELANKIAKTITPMLDIKYRDDDPFTTTFCTQIKIDKNSLYLR